MILLASCQQTLHDTPLLCVQLKVPDDGQRNCPKYVEFPSKINFRNWCIWLVYCKKFVTVHGHVNVKFRY